MGESGEASNGAEEKRRITRILANGFTLIRAIRRFLFHILTNYNKLVSS